MARAGRARPAAGVRGPRHERAARHARDAHARRPRHGRRDAAGRQRAHDRVADRGLAARDLRRRRPPLLLGAPAAARPSSCAPTRPCTPEPGGAWRPSSPSRWTILAGGTRLSGELSGEGAPVALLHGLTATRRYVVMGSRTLQRSGHRVLAYDARGHGASAPAADGDYGYPRLAGDLGAALDAAGFERAVLAGASMGAHTAVRFALEHPQRVAALVLDHARVRSRLRAQPGGARPLGRLGPGAARGWGGGLRRGIRPRQRGAGDAGRRSRPCCASGSPRTSIPRRSRTRSKRCRAQPRSRTRRSWRRIEVPALVVGSRDEPDPGHPLAVAERWAEWMPGARLVVEEPERSPIAWQGGSSPC